MRILFILSFIFVYANATIISTDKLLKIAEHVNSMKGTWEAGVNFDTKLKEIDVSHTVGAFVQKIKLENENDDHNDNNDNDDDDDDDDDDDEENSNENNSKAENCEDNGLPKTFDARLRWPKCKSIGHIYDQGNCGSCWAVSATSVFTDRICIESNGKFTSLRSSQQTLSCCHKCAGPDGCKGGWPQAAWDYFRRNGLVTGGDYDSNEGCQPYLLRTCSHHVNSTLPQCSSLKDEKAPKCKLHCYNRKYASNYKKDRIKSKSYYNVDPCSAMNEIYKNGPIVAIFSVFEDFYTYKSGVYRYTTGKHVGWHAVRVVGWGVENEIPYWLVTNSWNDQWGDKGYFKIIRGENDCSFEEFFFAGLAIL
ncbi:hypothetical protein PGB90_005986 [Kerria lacca]